MSILAAGGLIDRFLLGFNCRFIGSFPFLDVTASEESVVVFVPALGEKEFVSLLRTVFAFRHASAFIARRLRVFHSEHKTNDCLSVLGNLSFLSGLRIGWRNVSDEMPAVLVGLVHFHEFAFIKKRLLFLGESVCVTGIDRQE